MSEPIPIPTTLPQLVAFYPWADCVWLGSWAFTLAIPVIFLLAGFAPRLRTICARAASGNRYWTLVFVACSYLTIAAIIALPVGYLSEIAFMRAWNGPAPTTPRWLADRGVALLGSWAVAAAVIWIPYGLVPRVRRFWWLLSALAIWPLVVGGLVTYQLLLAPLFIHYRPPEGPLAARLESLAARCGVRHLQILVGGSDSTVHGLGPFQQIVLADDPDLTPAEITVTFAHELKHYLLDNTWMAIGAMGALLLLEFGAVALLGPAAIRGFAKRLGFSELADPASVPLVILILSASWLLFGLPAFNAVQRHIELEADRFALELTHDNRAQALLQVHFATYKLNEYYWFYQIWRANHPSQATRVRLANAYHPWTDGQALVYGRVCRMPSQ
jgi:STE24 endopeptidase